MKLFEIYSDINEDYPSNFIMDTFKSIKSYAGKIKYAKENLGKPLGSGTARTVFNIDGTKVLKLAKNQKGVAQNEAETTWYNNDYYDNIIANVIDFDEVNYYWVEMELAYKAKKSDFKRLWNVNFDDFAMYLINRDNVHNNKSKIYNQDPKLVYYLDNNDNVSTVVDFLLSTDMAVGDLNRISSWGIVKRPYGDTLVIIDFGGTEDVIKTYYKK